MTSLFSPSDLAQPVVASQPIIADLFAGGGGASTGLAKALGVEPHFAINHCETALSLHAANHPNTEHLITSVNAVDPRDLVKTGQRVGVLWASPDCTDFSRAKGSKPICHNRRSLAWIVPHWIDLVRPDVIFLENVAEFQQWKDFKKWKCTIQRAGYRVEFRLLRACDYGAPTIRTRLFMVARCDGRPIVWPTPTHGDPKSIEVQTGQLKPWRSAGSCIDWYNPMPSIFITQEEAKAWAKAHGLSHAPKRPLVPATLERIAKGIKKYVIDAKEPFFVSHAQHGGRNRSAADPLHTITASSKDQNQLVAARMQAVAGFMAQHNTGVTGRDLKAPLSTLLTRGTQQQLVAAHMMPHYGTSIARSAHDPMGTLTTRGGGKQILVASFLQKYFGTAIGSSLNDPCHTLTTKGRMSLVTVNICGQAYVITDICMRMLTPREQYRAQGFPEGYEIETGHDGRKLTKTEQTEKCGNSVSPPIADALASANVAHMFT